MEIKLTNTVSRRLRNQFLIKVAKILLIVGVAIMVIESIIRRHRMKPYHVLQKAIRERVMAIHRLSDLYLRNDQLNIVQIMDLEQQANECAQLLRDWATD